MEESSMQARMKSPVMVIPEAMQAMFALSKSMEGRGLSPQTVQLVHLRASQINGCSVCVDMHWRAAKQAGETDERNFAVAAWQDAPYFTDAERAALALAECVTRLADRSDPVPDAVWNEAARYYDEQALSALQISIGIINMWNRLNIPTKQVAGEWMKSQEARSWVEKHAAAD
jgi:AhpD family alkylhydroperoxidase